MSTDSQFLEMEFTVADQIRIRADRSQKYPQYREMREGMLMVLVPPCDVRKENVTASVAMAITPRGDELELEFNTALVNDAGCIGLLFEKATVEIVPNGSKVKFQEFAIAAPETGEEEPAGSDVQYLPQGKLDVPEAARILPRLEREGIRFQIDTDISAHPSEHRHLDSRIALFVHIDDVPAWEKIRGEYFPE